ncbi:hypothetical protein HIM_05233 [Hirsutella minnesotensis 3608]|uniref:Uncharacterized protein n=1 Tax=Hirsutella minnesotensis 3608 TaxID=1043627 RepID=A0A0F8A0G2_9HYPO|nr:hypothetical protein HIM_05233 [Hirsutella minnesotensis 3608]
MIRVHHPEPDRLLHLPPAQEEVQRGEARLLRLPPQQARVPLAGRIFILVVLVLVLILFSGRGRAVKYSRCRETLHSVGATSLAVR